MKVPWGSQPSGRDHRHIFWKQPGKMGNAEVPRVCKFAWRDTAGGGSIGLGSCTSVLSWPDCRLGFQAALTSQGGARRWAALEGVADDCNYTLGVLGLSFPLG